MQEPAATRSIYDVHDASRPQRFCLAILAALWVVLAYWILLGGGLGTICASFHRTWNPAAPTRRLVLAAALSIYCLRLLFTWFVFLRRGIRWPEVFAVASWLLCINLLVAIAGGAHTAPFRFAGWAGIALFVFGSWINSWSEHQRHAWKQLPGHAHQLFRQGLFRYCRHPNYLGDILSYTGLVLLSGVWPVAILPVVTSAGFVFVNIPALDAHLQRRYGDAFAQYARSTARLIPFLY